MLHKFMPISLLKIVYNRDGFGILHNLVTRVCRLELKYQVSLYKLDDLVVAHNDDATYRGHLVPQILSKDIL